MTVELQNTVILNNGVSMPRLGLGTYEAKTGGEVEQAVRWALDLGYRSIDTASVYKNEEGVGRGLRESGVPREDIFLTTKVWNDEQGEKETRRALERSLKRLGTEYVDLYLVHWPISEKMQSTWKAMEAIQKDGLAKAIGVSNFLVDHLERLLSFAEIVPAVNQIEFHPHLQQPDLVEYCRRKEIQVEAWSPLMKGRVSKVPELKAIGEKHGKSAAQVTLRWELQQDIVTIPKSARRERIEENADVIDFGLDEEDMQTINGLDQNQRTGPDPVTFTA